MVAKWIEVKRSFRYRAIVTRVIDGDTVECDIDLGCYTWLKGQKLRLLGLDAREMKDKPHGENDRQHLIMLLERYALPVDDGWELVLETTKDRHHIDEEDKYGRLLATLRGCDQLSGVEVNLNQRMLDDGHGRPYAT